MTGSLVLTEEQHRWCELTLFCISAVRHGGEGAARVGKALDVQRWAKAPSQRELRDNGSNGDSEEKHLHERHSLHKDKGRAADLLVSLDLAQAGICTPHLPRVRCLLKL